MRIIQFLHPARGQCLGVVQGDDVLNVTERQPALMSVVTAFDLARRRGRRLAEFVQGILNSGPQPVRLSFTKLLEAGQILPPLTEEAGRRLLVSGTGLTHLGSVQQRDQMHQAQESAGPKSDSRKMFELGVAGGRPEPGQRGAAPESGEYRLARQAA